MGKIILEIDGQPYEANTKGFKLNGKTVLFEDVAKNPQKYQADLLNVLSIETQGVLRKVETTNATPQDITEDEGGTETTTRKTKKT
jgi:hypothetical protein